MSQSRYFLLVGILAAFAIVNLFFIDSSYEVLAPYTYFIYLLAPLASLICAFRTGAIYGWKTRHGFSFAFVAAGFASWFVAEAIFSYYDLYLEVSPFPSIADLFFVLAAPLLTVGIISETLIAKAKPRLAEIFVGLVVLILVTAYLFGLVYDPDVSGLEKIVSLGYLSTDSLLVIAALYGLKISLEYGGRIRRPWVLMSIAAGLYLIGDFLYLLYLEQYEAREWLVVQLDIIWVTSYILFAWAMANIKDILAESEERFKQKISP